MPSHNSNSASCTYALRKAPYQTAHINITCGIVFHVKEKRALAEAKDFGVPRRQKLLQFTTTIATILNTNTQCKTDFPNVSHCKPLPMPQSASAREQSQGSVV